MTKFKTIYDDAYYDKYINLYTELRKMAIDSYIYESEWSCSIVNFRNLMDIRYYTKRIRHYQKRKNKCCK